MQQADDVSSYAREECPRIHGVRSLMIYSTSCTKLGNYYKCFFSGHCRPPLERTELHDAAERGEVERVQRLLSTGSLNINSRTVIVSISVMALVDTISIRFQITCCSRGGISLGCRPFFCGGGKTAWYNLFTHAQKIRKITVKSLVYVEMK